MNYRFLCSTALMLGLLGMLAPRANAQNPVPCSRPYANPENGGADPVIGTTPVVIFRPNTSLCSWLVINKSTTDAMRCRTINDGVVTATQGQWIPPGGVWSMGTEGQAGLRCILDETAIGPTITISGTWTLP